MKILHITINPIRLERRILNQVRSALARSYHIMLMALSTNKDEKSDTEEYQYIPIYTGFHRGGALKFLHYNLKVFLKGIRLYPTIIHAHDLWILPAAMLLSIYKKVPLIYDAHEYYQGLEIFTKRKIRKKIWAITEKLCMLAVNALITVSEPLAQLYRNEFNTLCPVHVIRNLPEYEVPDPELANILERPEKEKIILYHGHFKPGRGLKNLILAVKEIENTRLYMIGGGELEKNLRQITSQNVLGDRVIFMDYLPLQQLISTAAQADIGVALFEPTSLNYSYALPNKFFEYIMARLPVLASNIETFKSYISKYDVGKTVNPENISDISKRLREMLSEDSSLEKWSRNAELAANELNWNNESQKMIAIYEKLRRD